MKRLLSSLIIIISLSASCSRDISLTPGLSFLTPQPEIHEDTAIFRIISQPFSSVDSLKIPVTVGGTAQRGVDYEMSADCFLLSTESLMDSILVFTKQLGTGRTVSLSFQIPEGFVSGKYSTSEFRLQDKFGFLSFQYPEISISDTTDLAVILTDSLGTTKVLSKDTKVSIAVSKDNSTAIEGTDFEFVTPKDIIIPAGMSFSTIRIAPVGSGYKEGKDKIVLEIVADDRFELGQPSQMTITIADPEPDTEPDTETGSGNE